MPAIVSASRRTDIPAFYSDWFLQRLHEGSVIVRNPFNPAQLRKISLLPSDVACIVFWSKNPTPLLKKLNAVDAIGIPYYFLITINDYGHILEPGVPQANDILQAVATLSSRIGSLRIRWRYDPIILSDELTPGYHIKTFERLASILAPYTQHCIISFFQGYKKSLRNIAPFHTRAVCKEEKLELAGQLVAIAQKKGIALQWCAPEDDITDSELSSTGIAAGACIDGALITKLTKIGNWRKDTGQRRSCLCVKSIDIGAYNTCAHGCRYCYATTNHGLALQFYRMFNKDSTSLSDNVSDQPLSDSAPSSKSKNRPM